MKRIVFVVIMLSIVAFAFPVFAGDNGQWDNIPVKAQTTERNDFSITYSTKDEWKTVTIKITGVKINPNNDSAPSDFLVPKIVRMASGIESGKEEGKKNPFFAQVEVKNGTIVFDYKNGAKESGVPEVDHFWGRGKTESGVLGSLVLYASDPNVAYEKGPFGGVDEDTFAICLVLFPNEAPKPCMSFGKGKLPHGKYGNSSN